MAKRRIALRTLLTIAAMALLIASVAGVASGAKASKVNICHSTLIPSDPYEFISVSSNAVKAHQAHHSGQDIIGVNSAADCPGPVQPAQCADGIDNDGDTLIDYPNDPGCDNADDNDETNVQQCNNATQSGGEGVTTTVHELGATSGTFEFDWDAQNIPDQFEVIYEGNVIFDTGSVSGTGTQQIPYSGSSSQVTVRVTGPSGTAWSYVVNCPTPPSV